MSILLFVVLISLVVFTVICLYLDSELHEIAKDNIEDARRSFKNLKEYEASLFALQASLNKYGECLNNYSYALDIRSEHLQNITKDV